MNVGETTTTTTTTNTDHVTFSTLEHFFSWRKNPCPDCHSVDSELMNHYTFEFIYSKKTNVNEGWWWLQKRDTNFRSQSFFLAIFWGMVGTSNSIPIEKSNELLSFRQELEIEQSDKSGLHRQPQGSSIDESLPILKFFTSIRKSTKATCSYINLSS